MPINQQPFKVPILTYHSVHIDGVEYHNNDHVGLAKDLQIIRDVGWTVVSVGRVVNALLLNQWESLPDQSVAITFDDGSWFDWYDLVHPHYGLQKSFINILRDHIKSDARYNNANELVTSFVIASPAARTTLDERCLIGKGWWSDQWWAAAEEEGLMSIQNHSWDHKHHTIDKNDRYGESYGNFETIKDYAECDWQVLQAQKYIHQQLNSKKSRYFAYPYGHYPDILSKDYLPNNAEKTGLLAAFTTEPNPVTALSNRWNLPRYVFRKDWDTTGGLLSILNES